MNETNDDDIYYSLILSITILLGIILFIMIINHVVYRDNLEDQIKKINHIITTIEPNINQIESEKVKSTFLLLKNLKTYMKLYDKVEIILDDIPKSYKEIIDKNKYDEIISIFMEQLSDYYILHETTNRDIVKLIKEYKQIK